MIRIDASAWQLGYRFSRRPNAVEIPESAQDRGVADHFYDSPPIGSTITGHGSDGSTLLYVLAEDETGFVWCYYPTIRLWRPAWPSIPQRLADDSPDERGSL